MSISKMYFNYDNDKQVYVVPVLPEELQITIKGETNSITIDRFGEVLHKGKRDGIIVKYSSFFPASYGDNYCSCSRNEFRSATAWHKWMQELLNADNPCHFVYTNSPGAINIYADITSYSATEKGGDPGTIYYTVELKEHRNPTVKKYTKPVTANATKVTVASAPRVNNSAASNQYKVTAGVGLNLRTGVWGSWLATMPYNMVVTTDGQTNSGWAHVCYNGRWGWASLTYLQKC